VKQYNNVLQQIIAFFGPGCKRYASKKAASEDTAFLYCTYTGENAAFIRAACGRTATNTEQAQGPSQAQKTAEPTA
jgi:hypothetical protein